jgi:hypothetical protein
VGGVGVCACRYVGVRVGVSVCVEKGGGCCPLVWVSRYVSDLGKTRGVYVWLWEWV